MTKQSDNAANEIEVLGEVAVSRTEQFLETNGKKFITAVAVIVVAAVAIFGYQSLVSAPTEQRAAEAMFEAQAIFDAPTPDYQLALDGSTTADGFLSVIEEYPSTQSGNLAKHYAGICYLQLGDLDAAKRYLKAYKPQKGIPAEIINAQNLALQGDIAVDEGDYTSAITLFNKAAESSTNSLTSPLYMRKAAQAAQAVGDSAMAIDLYNKVLTLYPSSMEARNAEKYLGSIKGSIK